MDKSRSIFKKLVNNVTLGTANLALLAFLILFTCYALFWPITPAVYSNLQIQNSSQVYAGQPLSYKLDSCRKVGDGVVTTITRSLISTTDKKLQPISLSSDTIAAPAHCSHVSRSVLLPYSMPSGKYELLVRGVYQIIPIRKAVAVEIKSAPFSVNATSLTEQIEELINANNLLQNQLTQQEAKQSSTSTSTSVTNTTPSGSSTTTNKTTTTNNPPATAPKTTSNQTPPAQTTSGGTGSGGSGNKQNQSILQGIIKALGGGIQLQL